MGVNSSESAPQNTWRVFWRLGWSSWLSKSLLRISGGTKSYFRFMGKPGSDVFRPLIKGILWPSEHLLDANITALVVFCCVGQKLSVDQRLTKRQIEDYQGLPGWGLETPGLGFGDPWSTVISHLWPIRLCCVPRITLQILPEDHVTFVLLSCLFCCWARDHHNLLFWAV